MEESYKTEKLMRKVRVQYILPDKGGTHGRTPHVTDIIEVGDLDAVATSQKIS